MKNITSGKQSDGGYIYCETCDKEHYFDSVLNQKNGERAVFAERCNTLLVWDSNEQSFIEASCHISEWADGETAYYKTSIEAYETQ